MIEGTKKYFINTGSVGQTARRRLAAPAYCIYHVRQERRRTAPGEVRPRDRSGKNHQGRIAALVGGAAQIGAVERRPEVRDQRSDTEHRKTKSILIIKPSSLGDIVHTFAGGSRRSERRIPARRGNHVGDQSGMDDRCSAANPGRGSRPTSFPGGEFSGPEMRRRTLWAVAEEDPVVCRSGRSARFSGACCGVH